MSFILDALRKSENERQRNTTPGLASAPVRPTSNRRSPWIPLVAVLLGVNLSLVAVLWYTGDEPDTAAPEATADLGPATRMPVDTTANVPAELPIADPTVSRELSTELDPPAVSTSAAPSTATATATASVPGTFQPPASVAPTDSGAGAGLVQVPTLSELVLDGTVSLPPLHLDLHVYSKTPAERFVFINTAKYREGERISEGPVVDEINQTGVVLKHQNRRFLLTRE